MQLPPIAATTIGSFPRPGWLATATRSQTTFNLEGDRLREGLDDATSLAIRDQELAGLDLVTDGEQRRPHFIDHILNSWDGVDTVNRGPQGIIPAARRGARGTPGTRRHHAPDAGRHRGPPVRQGTHGPAPEDGRARPHDRGGQHPGRPLR